MKFDFENDLKNELIEGLLHYEVKVEPYEDINDYIIDYLTIMKKAIRPQPRKVTYNPDFLLRLDKHPKQKEIKYLAELFSKGSDVNYFQSKTLFLTRFHDHLSYEWNIFHFHLSLEKEGKFARRTDALLFVYLTDDEAIFLDTDTHREGVFGETKWQEILHDHFYHILEPFYDPEITDISPEIKTGAERQMIWNKGLTLGMTKIRGKIFHSPGIGRSTSRHSMLVTKQTIEVYRWLRSMEEQFKTHWPWVCYMCNFNPENTFFKLRFGKTTLEIYESTTGQKLLTYPELLAHPSVVKELAD